MFKDRKKAQEALEIIQQVCIESTCKSCYFSAPDPDGFYTCMVCDAIPIDWEINPHEGWRLL